MDPDLEPFLEQARRDGFTVGILTFVGPGDVEYQAVALITTVQADGVEVRLDSWKQFGLKLRGIKVVEQ